MELKNWKRYTINLIAILTYIISVNMIYRFIKSTGFTSYSYLVYLGIYSFIIGMIFALGHLVKEIKKSGKWKIHWGQIIFCVLPLLYFASYTLFFFFSATHWIYPNLIYGLFQYFIQDTFIASVAEVLLGYALVTSFYKRESKAENISL